VAKKDQIVNVHEAKTHLSRILERVARGDEVTIAKAGKPVARLVPVRPPKRRPLGIDAGRVVVSNDFDAPLPDEILSDFER
jgi:prevent-host-death family protein